MRAAGRGPRVRGSKNEMRAAGPAFLCMRAIGCN